MKYSTETYLNFEFYAPDEDVQNHRQKIIKTRKTHKCVNCQSEIKQGEQALLETCFMDGPKSAHTCMDCCDKMISEVMKSGL